ncbi:MAG: hypothetical protein HY306_02240 [Nitrosomonadales bacterium]|nr:hypothetical protein [Nitrosomonadales bacterium]
MKPKTMKRLLALPEEHQEKVWKLAMDRLKEQAIRKNKKSQKQDEPPQK